MAVAYIHINTIPFLREVARGATKAHLLMRLEATGETYHFIEVSHAS